MTFEDFMNAYNIANFIWEIFKGISPTIIALLTIWINNTIIKKKSQKDELSREVKELQLMTTNLIPYIMDTGKNLLEAIQRSKDQEESDEFFSKFEYHNNSMLIEVRRILMYANIKKEIFHREEMDFSSVSEAVKAFSKELLDILEWYNSKAVITPHIQHDELCDEVQKKLIIATNVVEEKLEEYCVKLGKDSSLQTVVDLNDGHEGKMSRKEFVKLCCLDQMKAKERIENMERDEVVYLKGELEAKKINLGKWSILAVALAASISLGGVMAGQTGYNVNGLIVDGFIVMIMVVALAEMHNRWQRSK